MVSGRWKVLLAIAVVVLVVGGIVLAHRLRGPKSDPEALRVMERAARARHEVTVRGVVETKVRTGGGLREMRVEIHQGAGRMHLKFRSGPHAGAQVFRQGGQVWATGPDGKVRRGAHLHESPWHHGLVKRNYQVQLGNKTTLLGRPATYVKGKGPSGELTLAADDETGFPLAMERRDRDGEIVMSTTYVEVNFSADPPPEREVPKEAAVAGGPRGAPVSREELEARMGRKLLLPTYLPRGFELEGYYLRERGRRKVAQIRYADGLRVLLVMEMKPPHRGPEQMGRRGPQGRKATEGMRGLHGHAVRRRVGDIVVIVVGPLSEAELGRVADSVR